MRLLTAVDQLFLLLETRNQPMHIGGLFLFKLPDHADENFVHNLVQEMMHSKAPPTFPFNQVLHHSLFWKTDPDLELEQHFRHIALPQPARIRELLVYISQEHGKLLNRPSRCGNVILLKVLKAIALPCIANCIIHWSMAWRQCVWSKNPCLSHPLNGRICRFGR